MLAGIEGLDYGSINVMKGIRAGYLPQDGITLSGRTVFNECLSVFDEIRALEASSRTRTAHGANSITRAAEYAQIAERYHHVQSSSRRAMATTSSRGSGAVSPGLGFRREDWQRRVEEFSGGWQMRIALAKLLLEEPNLLLLDEPTNHLDLEARNWLEAYLETYPNAFVLISHDRYFLDVTVTKIAEIWNKRVHFYTGGYSKYEQQKTERRAQLEAAYRNQRERIEQLEAFINRFRYQATKAKQVQSRIKELEKIERIEIPPEEKTIHFRFPQPKPSGRIVAEFRNVAKSYGEKHVFSRRVVHDRARRPGGAGRSERGGQIDADQDAVGRRAGDCRRIHARPQCAAGLFRAGSIQGAGSGFGDPGRSGQRGAARHAIRNCAASSAAFCFPKTMCSRRIGVLSGGERNRYALARMLMMPGNFLLLDEPTNHLDMRAKDVLLTALQEFTGTVVFVSHDRYFIDKLATRVFEVAEAGRGVPRQLRRLSVAQEWRRAARLRSRSSAETAAGATQSGAPPAGSTAAGGR